MDASEPAPLLGRQSQLHPQLLQLHLHLSGWPCTIGVMLGKLQRRGVVHLLGKAAAGRYFAVPQACRTAKLSPHSAWAADIGASSPCWCRLQARGEEPLHSLLPSLLSPALQAALPRPNISTTGIQALFVPDHLHVSHLSPGHSGS